MLCDKTHWSDVDRLSQTGTDNAKVTFCLIPKMLVCVLIFDSVCLCVCTSLCNPPLGEGLR